MSADDADDVTEVDGGTTWDYWWQDVEWQEDESSQDESSRVAGRWVYYHKCLSRPYGQWVWSAPGSDSD